MYGLRLPGEALESWAKVQDGLDRAGPGPGMLLRYGRDQPVSDRCALVCDTSTNPIAVRFNCMLFETISQD